jgi:hypothetical protein
MMATLTFDGSRGLPHLSAGQVTAFALAVKGLLGVQDICFGGEIVAGLALFHRLTFPPEVATLLVIVVTLFAGDTGLGVAAMAELDRRLFPVWFLNFQPALTRRGGGVHRCQGPQAPKQQEAQEPTA